MFNPIILEKSCNSRTLEIPKFSELYIVNERFCFGDKNFFLNVKKRISQEYGRWSDGISCCDDWREFKSRFRNSFWSGETHISVAAANVVDHNILFCVDRHTYLCSKICQCVDLFFFYSMLVGVQNEVTNHWPAISVRTCMFYRPCNVNWIRVLGPTIYLPLKHKSNCVIIIV